MAHLSTDYPNREKITIKNAEIDGDQTDFPVLVQLSNNALYANARADGYDIRFTQSNGTTLLKYERQNWSGGGGSNVTANFWVKSNVTAASAIEIYIYWGHASASDGEDKNNVWDGNFEAVYHLHADVNDSTSNGYNLTKSGAGVTHVAGKVGNCIELDGSEYAYVNSAPASSEPITLECWANGIAEGSGSFIILQQDRSEAVGVLLGYRSDSDVGNGEMDTLSRVPGPDGEATTANQASDNTWFYGVATWAATNSRAAYINADAANKGTDATNAPASGLDRFILGAWFEDVGGDFNHWTGKIDEARVSSIARSEAWLKWTHANINSGDNELTFNGKELNTFPAALELNQTIPGVTVIEGAGVTVSPAAINIDMTIPGVTITEGTGITVAPAVIPINVNLPGVTVSFDMIFNVDAIQLNVNLPTPTITAISQGIIRLISEIDTSESFRSVIDTEVKILSKLESGD